MKWISDGTLSREAVLKTKEFVERQRESTLVKKAIAGEISILTEARAYYGIDSTGKLSEFYEHEKERKSPDHIIEILKGFEGGQLNKNLLKYEKVRNIYHVPLWKFLIFWKEHSLVKEEFDKYQEMAANAHTAILTYLGKFPELCDGLGIQIEIIEDFPILENRTDVPRYLN